MSIEEQIAETNRLLTIANERLDVLGLDIGAAINAAAAQASRRRKRPDEDA